ncbi:MAG: hypothetical protein LBI42_03605, partial [Chitinispirillales bacterium]|nr:hypothetical protein [Chitinispirillales bacterium]
ADDSSWLLYVSLPIHNVYTHTCRRWRSVSRMERQMTPCACVTALLLPNNGLHPSLRYDAPSGLRNISY